MKKNVADELIASMQEALDHARGRPVKVRTSQVRLGAVDVKRIRQKLGMTQDRFSFVLGVSLSGLRKWEQRQRQPRGAALTLLHIMNSEPKAVARALASVTQGNRAEARPDRTHRSEP